jgi:hypothetical protein
MFFKKVVSLAIHPRWAFCVLETSILANTISGSLGLLEVLSLDNGFFLFTFDSVNSVANFLFLVDKTLWHMDNRHLVLRRW